MLRYLLAPLAALVLLTASLIPDDAYARRGGGGGGGGGFRGGGGGSLHGGGFRGGGGYRGGGVRHILSQAARVVPDMDTPVVPVVRATRSQAEVTIADTAGLHWEPQRLVLRPMALMEHITIATMRTAIGSVPISINIDTR